MAAVLAVVGVRFGHVSICREWTNTYGKSILWILCSVSYLLLHNKLTQSKHLKTTSIYHLAVSVGQEPHGIANVFGIVDHLRARQDWGKICFQTHSQVYWQDWVPRAIGSRASISCRMLAGSSFQPLHLGFSSEGNSQHFSQLPAEQAMWESKRGRRGLFVPQSQKWHLFVTFCLLRASH